MTSDGLHPQIHSKGQTTSWQSTTATRSGCAQQASFYHESALRFKKTTSNLVLEPGGQLRDGRQIVDYQLCLKGTIPMTNQPGTIHAILLPFRSSDKYTNHFLHLHCKRTLKPWGPSYRRETLLIYRLCPQHIDTLFKSQLDDSSTTSSSTRTSLVLGGYGDDLGEA